MLSDRQVAERLVINDMLSWLHADSGNFYSIRGEHAKAVSFFRRALKLDKSYLAAWTLMGHEYVELSNTHAAIESYRRACGPCFPHLRPNSAMI